MPECTEDERLLLDKLSGLKHEMVNLPLLRAEILVASLPREFKEQLRLAMLKIERGRFEVRELLKRAYDEELLIKDAKPTNDLIYGIEEWAENEAKK